jgi:aspartate-semialdehyde dehydrogenase
MTRKRCAVVGATGIAGQQFLVALDGHPWFEVARLAASERSAGKTYADAIRDDKSGARRWWCVEPPPASMLDLRVENGEGLDLDGIDIVFSAVESDAARALEPRYAKTTAVLSTASAFRYEDDVLIMVPGVNHGHAAQIDRQRRLRGWSGFVVPLLNCTTMGLVITLKPTAA